MKTAKRITLLVLLLVVGFAGFAVAREFLGLRERYRETRKGLEAAIAREEGFEVALEASDRERLRLVNESEVLRRRIENLGERLDAKVKVVTRKGATVEVPVEVLVPVPKLVEVPADCIGCVEDYLDSLPPFEFRVEALDALLETEAGVVVATGEVELYRTSPVPEVLLGRKEWETTTALVSKPVAVYSRFGYFVDFDFVLDPESFGFTYIFDDVPNDFSFSQDKTRITAGPEVTFGGSTFRLGISTDSAVRFGFSKRRRKR